MNDKPQTHLEIAVDQLDEACATHDDARANATALIGVGYALVAIAELMAADHEYAEAERKEAAGLSRVFFEGPR